MSDVMLARVHSDRADSNTVSMLLWITVVVVLVIGVSVVIYKAIANQGDRVSKNIADADERVVNGIGGALTD